MYTREKCISFFNHDFEPCVERIVSPLIGGIPLYITRN